MYKQHLLNNIEKEINICKRLYTKLPADKMNYTPGEGIRTSLELLQYLTTSGVMMPGYWINGNGSDFGEFYGSRVAAAKAMPHENFLSAMDEQMAAIKKIFEQITEEDLHQKEVVYPWNGVKAPLGEAIIATSTKWLAAYKLQLFLFIKLCADKKLATADAWVLTELPA